MTNLKQNKHANIDWTGIEENKCQIQIHNFDAFKAEISKLTGKFTDNYLFKTCQVKLSFIRLQ